MRSPARLNQGPWTPQDDGRTESPEDEESSLSPMPRCPCQRLWDENNRRLPSPHLPDGDVGYYVKQGIPLYKAALNGDLKEMRRILSREINNKILCSSNTILRSSLSEAHETALHIAAGAEKATNIVRELVRRMEPQDLELRDRIGNTAFCKAAAKGNVKIAKILKQKGKEVELMRGAKNKTPLYIAAVAGHPEMVRFLYENFRQHITENHLENDELRDILFAFIHASLFDLASQMLNDRRHLAWAHNDEGETALGILAQKPSAFASKKSTRPRRLLIDFLCCGLNTIPMQKEALELTDLLCKKISSDDEQIKLFFDKTVDHAGKLMFEAAKLGNDKFLSVLIGYYPDLIFRKDEHKRSIFHTAVLHRHASIFKLIHNMGLQRDVIVRYIVDYKKDGEIILYNMLHLAAKLPSWDRLSIVSGPALQMQRELLWFKEVENLMPPSEREKRDGKDNLKPRELFTKEHEELRKAGEEWMRNTAESGMLVATIIITVVFTTASALPGGNNDKDGSPVDLGKVMFDVFMVSDAVAMCSSIISAMMFLSILTSRYAEEDFLIRLPLKLVSGFTALLLSMMALMVSFTAMFFLAYGKGHLLSVAWVPCLAFAMSFLPIISFVVLEYKLLCDVFRSTFGSKFLFRPNKSTF